MKSARLIFAATLLASPSGGLAAASGGKYYVVLTDVFGASASNFAGPYASKAACLSDEKAFQSKATSPAEVYVCELRKKAEIDKLTEQDRQGLEQRMLNSK
jgi:hypothetical protein